MVDSSVSLFPHSEKHLERSVFRSGRFWTAIGLCAVLYLPSLFWALGLDQNIFAEIGSLLLAGKKPYANAWDVKPPNIFYTYALFEWLFGQREFAIRLSDYCFAIAACAAMYAWIDRITSRENIARWAPFVASILLILTLLSLGLADTAQTESYSLVFLILAALLIMTNDKLRMTNGNTEIQIRHSSFVIRHSVFIAGAALGIATFYKSTNAIFLLPLAIEIVILQRKWLLAIAALIAGFLLVCGIELGVLGIQGNLNEYLTIAMSVARAHPEEVSNLRFASMFHAIWTMVDLWSIVAIAAIICATITRNWLLLKTLRLPLLYLVVGLVAVYLQNKGWGYHYVIILPGLIATCAIASIYLYTQLQRIAKPLAIAAAIIVVGLTLTISPSARRRWHYTQEAKHSVASHQMYLASLGTKESLYYPLCTDSLANYIRAQTSASDRVFIFGEEPGAYWKSARLPATRYIYSLLFTSGVISQNDLQVMQDTLIHSEPALVIVERFDTLGFRNRPETSESLLRDDSTFRPLRDMLQQNYFLRDTLCGKFLVYRRK
jgi:hypothetical protein